MNRYPVTLHPIGPVGTEILPPAKESAADPDWRLLGKPDLVVAQGVNGRPQPTLIAIWTQDPESHAPN